MSSEPLLGEIMMWGGTFAPSGWAFCDGATLSIAQNTALFSLLGTTYGGNGTSTFRLPDLQGRMPMGTGTGTGLTPRVLGDSGGSESATLTLPSQAFNSAAEGTAAIVLGPPPATPTQIATMPPYQTLSFVIALQGIYPSRP